MDPKPEPKPKPEEDRLAVLPDELLLHILSFLDPADIFVASLYIPRWRRVFAATPVLSFSYAAYCNRFGRTGSDGRFAGIVRACLEHRDLSVPLREFVYDAEDSRVEPRRIEGLVSAAARLGVRRLELAGDFVKLQLPASLYNCLSLKELTLRSRYISLSNEQGFPALTKMQLELVPFSKAKLESHIFSRCPNLETLILTDCNIDDDDDDDETKQFRIRAPKLTKLVILYPFDLWYLDDNLEFIIDAPRLASFYYRGIKALNCTLVSSHSLLDEAGFDVFTGKGELLDGGLRSDHKIAKLSGLIRMINAFKFARTIKLSQPTIKCLSQASELGLQDHCDDRLRDILEGISEPVNS